MGERERERYIYIYMCICVDLESLIGEGVFFWEMPT